MKYSLTSKIEAAHSCSVIAIYEDAILSPSGTFFDQLTGGYLTQLIEEGDIKGTPNHCLLLPKVPYLDQHKLLLVGCGKQDKVKPDTLRDATQSAIAHLQTTSIKEACFCLTDLNIADYDNAWKIQQIVLAIEASTYTFTPFKKPKTTTALEHIVLIGQAQHAIEQGQAIAAGIHFAKDLANLPANVCTPTYLAEQAKELSREFSSIRVKILEEKHLKKQGMHAFLAVSQGSHQNAKLIDLHYHGDPNMPPVVLVGKGITFDAGGISLKPSASMDEMKYDMCGAASVLGVLRTIAQLKLPLNVIGIIAASENLPGGGAIKPGDIVKSASGKTIEILNTDAEGRLVLCDALHYVQQYQPACVIDIATLTGAAIVALGHERSCLMGNNEALIQSLREAGDLSQDKSMAPTFG